MTIHEVREFHVSMTGDDNGEGTASAPLKTISVAASKAQPGDVVTVHEGVYRERISPPRGGISDNARIVYQAAVGERVEIKGSEVIKDWLKVHGDVWKTTIPNAFFGDFNPYLDLIKGDWFLDNGRSHHTGAVYLHGDWLLEAAELKDVLDNVGDNSYWFSSVDEANTTIWANFGDLNPNEECVEINVRQSVFYPEAPGINYITVRGFIMRHAATPWAPPTAEQIGLIGTNWSKGWIIEGNTISHSKCTGITLGKYGDEWDNKEESAEAYTRTIERALENGWNSEQVGHHLVRNNTVSHCEMAGIAGSLGACYSVITENCVHDIHVQRLFTGYEMAGIKFHGAIDTLISKNRIFRSDIGIWSDWMTQGTRLSANLLYDNHHFDIFIEVSHGPFLVDHNLCLSDKPTYALFNVSQGGTYAHNLFWGNMFIWPDPQRVTPFQQPHSTAIAGTSKIFGGDDRYYNNIFNGQDGPRRRYVFLPEVEPMGLERYDHDVLPVFMSGNVYLKGSQPSIWEESPFQDDDLNPDVRLIFEDEEVFLHFSCRSDWKNERKRDLVTTESLGKTHITQQLYIDTDGTQICLNRDYAGEDRDVKNPSPGPFEHVRDGLNVVKVW